MTAGIANIKSGDEEPVTSMGAAENDRKHDDLCVGSMGIRPHG